MVSKELRIGNLVNVDNPEYHPEITIDKIPMKITGICMGGNGYSIQLNTLDITKQDVSPFISQYAKFIIPISLTDEWYEKSNLHYYLGSENGCYLSKCGDKWVLGIISMGVVALTIMVEYVHELQNIYFCLFKKELEL